jgi:hypothetical protein
MNSTSQMGPRHSRTTLAIRVLLLRKRCSTTRSPLSSDDRRDRPRPEQRRTTGDALLSPLSGGDRRERPLPNLLTSFSERWRMTGDAAAAGTKPRGDHTAGDRDLLKIRPSFTRDGNSALPSSSPRPPRSVAPWQDLKAFANRWTLRGSPRGRRPSDPVVLCSARKAAIRSSGVCADASRDICLPVPPRPGPTHLIEFDPRVYPQAGVRAGRAGEPGGASRRLDEGRWADYREAAKVPRRRLLSVYVSNRLEKAFW